MESVIQRRLLTEGGGHDRPNLGPWLIVLMGFSLILFLILVGLVMLFDPEGARLGKTILVYSSLSLSEGLALLAIAFLIKHNMTPAAKQTYNPILFFGSTPLGFLLGAWWLGWFSIAYGGCPCAPVRWLRCCPIVIGAATVTQKGLRLAALGHKSTGLKKKVPDRPAQIGQSAPHVSILAGHDGRPVRLADVPEDPRAISPFHNRSWAKDASQTTATKSNRPDCGPISSADPAAGPARH